jgi:hypothetical protein
VGKKSRICYKICWALIMPPRKAEALVCVGANNYGQLGLGTSQDEKFPMDIKAFAGKPLVSQFKLCWFNSHH